MSLPMQICLIDPRLGSEYPLPKYETKDSAGLDLRAMIDKPLDLKPGQTELISTGMKVWIRDPNRTGLLLPRSSLGHKKGLVLGNLVGLIDADYQGPLMISAWNRNFAGDPIRIEPGERLAQLVVALIDRPALEIVDQFESTSRGEGGFGSTGLR